MKFTLFQDLRVSGSNILLICAAFGDFIFILLRIIPSAVALNDDELAQMMKEDPMKGLRIRDVKFQSKMLFATFTLDIVQIFTQTVILILISNSQFVWSHITGYKRATLKFLLQFLAMSNFVNWLNGSFLEFDLVRETPWNQAIYTGMVWTGLLQVSLPVALFFRIHSVHSLMEIYIDYKSQSAIGGHTRRMSL